MTSEPKTPISVLPPGNLPPGFELSKCFEERKFRIGPMLFEVLSINDKKLTVTLEFKGLAIPEKVEVDNPDQTNKNLNQNNADTRS